jgi:hypothetical protein
VALCVLRAATFASESDPNLQLVDELLHPVAIGFEGCAGGIDLRFEEVHAFRRQSQQSDMAGIMSSFH